MRLFRLLWRALFLVVYTSAVVLQVRLFNVFLGKNMQRTLHIRRAWARRLLAFCGVKVTVEGTIPEVSGILVANHRSYLDPIVLLRDVMAYPVAKAEMAHWPILGRGAQVTGIIYLQREDTGSRLSTLRQMAAKIAQGFSIIIFPEGTTSDLAGTLPFKPGGFQLAAKLKVPIIPTVLIYPDDRDFWVGEVSFLAHARRRFGEKSIVVTVRYGPALRDGDPDALAGDCRAWMDAQLITVPVLKNNKIA